MIRHPPTSTHTDTPFPYSTRFRSPDQRQSRLLIPKNLHSPREVYQCHARKITADFAGLPPVTKCTFEVQPRGGQLATTKQAHALELQSKDKRLHVVPAFPNLNKPIAGGDGIRELTRVEVRTKKPIESRSEEHTSELQSLMRISYAVFCLKKKQSD